MECRRQAQKEIRREARIQISSDKQELQSSSTVPGEVSRGLLLLSQEQKENDKHVYKNSEEQKERVHPG